MSQQELLRRVVQVLDELAIEYMITGSIASSLQGEPRATHDVDIVVRIENSNVKAVVNAFPSSDYYLSEDSVRDAIASRRMFNLIDMASGDKVDFWLLTETPFDLSRFSRKCVEEFEGARMFVSAPEDTILAKLRWAKRSGGSEKQFADALRVYEVQFEKLDIAYLEHWAEQLDLQPFWRRLKEEAEPI